MKARFRFKAHKDYPMLYMLPALIVLILLVGAPIVKNVISSFTYKGVFPATDNYARLFKDRYFIKDIKNTFRWLLYTVSLEMVFGLTMAVLLNMKIRFQKLFRTIFIVPWVIPAIVVCIIWKWMYNADYSILNHMLMNAGLISAKQLFIADPKQVLFCIALVYVWKISPFVMIMYLSGLQSISDDIYEAATLDGASRLRQVFEMTIPLLFPVIRSVLLVSIIWSLNSFVYVYSISGGGPARVSELVQIFIYKTGIEQFKFEFSAAAANSFFIIVMAVAFVYNMITEKAENNIT